MKLTEAHLVPLMQKPCLWLCLSAPSSQRPLDASTIAPPWRQVVAVLEAVSYLKLSRTPEISRDTVPMATWAWNTNNEVDAEVKRALLNYRPIFARYARTSVDLHDRYREHITWTQTKRSFAEATSSTGCHLCIIIAHAFDKASIDEFAQMGPNETFKLRFEYRTAERDPSGKLDWEQRTRMSISNIILESHLPDEFWLRIRPEEPSRFKKLYIDLRMRPLKGSATGHVMDTVPRIHASTGNKQNLRLASIWLKACEDAHPMCEAFRPQKPDWRPSRLIHVGSASQEPKLVISPDNIGKVPYAALSYCWGSSKSVVLTLNKLVEYQDELPVATLPATIRDAIEITKELGYEYLWVDALCIIQDSREDWEIESPQMGDVYGLAAITLAAAGSSSKTDSMYRRRDPRTVRPCVVNIGNEIRKPGRGSRWAVYPQEPERLHSTAFADNPLSRRAWTLQERILSPRLLMFGEKQVMWSCVTTEACETFPSGLDPGFSTPLNELRSLANLRQRFMRVSAVEELPSIFWNDIIHMYTKAGLTVSSDKLVALQGIVKRMIEKIKAGHDGHEIPTDTTNKYEYVAGLWRDKNFQRNLLWRPKSDPSRHRPENYRAPSWSWASLDGEIIPYEEFVVWAWNKNEIELASIVEVHIEPLLSHTASLTGQVVGGRIHMHCHIRPCHLFKNPGSGIGISDASQSDAIITVAKSGSEPCERILPEKGSFVVNGDDNMCRFSDYCTLDCPEEIPSSQWIKVYCVPLQLASLETDRYEHAVWESYEGLVLFPVRDEDSATALQDLDIGQKCAETTSTVTVDTHCKTTVPSTLRTFRRIGTFAYHMNNDNREARQDELFGPMTKKNSRTPSREKEFIRII